MPSSHDDLLGYRIYHIIRITALSGTFGKTELRIMPTTGATVRNAAAAFLRIAKPLRPSEREHFLRVSPWACSSMKRTTARSRAARERVSSETAHGASDERHPEIGSPRLGRVLLRAPTLCNSTGKGAGSRLSRPHSESSSVPSPGQAGRMRPPSDAEDRDWSHGMRPTAERYPN